MIKWFGFFIGAMLILQACSKSSAPAGVTGAWQLKEKKTVAGVGSWVSAPAGDSAVALLLEANYTYTTTLNGQTISHGSYTLQNNQGNQNGRAFQILELKDFRKTGIFDVFAVEQIGANQQVLSVFDGFIMQTSHDSLFLSSVLAPGGNVSYIFVKQ